MKQNLWNKLQDWWKEQKDMEQGRDEFPELEPLNIYRRLITSHVVEGDNPEHQVQIRVIDEPGQGGACHEYQIWAGNTITPIHFQNGPIREHGVNGLTHEALLAIVIDRLESFQAGPYACSENALALNASRQALAYLQVRTKKRLQRQVEGTNQK